MKICIQTLLRAFAITGMGLLVASGGSAAQDTNLETAKSAYSAAQNYLKENGPQVVDQYRQLLATLADPLEGSDQYNRLTGLQAFLKTRGFTVRVWETRGGPYLFAEREAQNAAETLLIVSSMGDDLPKGDASDPITVLRDADMNEGGQQVPWDTVQEFGSDPDWQVYAPERAANGAGLIALGAALDALSAANIEPRVTLKLLIRPGSPEKAGSLDRVMTDHQKDLIADLILVPAGERSQASKTDVIFGARGLANATATIYGPSRSVSVQTYANFVASPVDELIRVLGTMKGRDGTLLVPGLTRGAKPASDIEKEAVAGLVSQDRQLIRDLALGRTEGTGVLLDLLTMRPFLHVESIRFGLDGNTPPEKIPSQASADLRIGLAPGQSVKTVKRALEAHLISLGFHGVPGAPDIDTLRNHTRVASVSWDPAPYSGYRGPLNGPKALQLMSLIEAIEGEKPTLRPMIGDSLPLALMAEALPKSELVIMPISQPGAKTGQPDEHIQLGSLFDAIETYAALFAGL